MFVFRHKFIDKFLRCQTALFTFRVSMGREKRGQIFRVIKVLGFFTTWEGRLKKNRYIFRGGNSVKIDLFAFKKKRGLLLKERLCSPCGSKFFPFGEVSFRKGAGAQECKQKIAVVIFLVKHVHCQKYCLPSKKRFTLKGNKNVSLGSWHIPFGAAPFFRWGGCEKKHKGNYIGCLSCKTWWKIYHKYQVAFLTKSLAGTLFTHFV